MPRPPDWSTRTRSMGGSLFSSIGAKIKTHSDAGNPPPIPLHVGDTWLQPPAGCRLEDITAKDHAGLNRYTLPHGHPKLTAFLAEHHNVDPAQLLISAGATGGLACVAHGTLDAGDEVLVLAPYWPLIRGIIQSADGVPVEVPFYDRLDSGSVTELIEPHITERTTTLYINTPNNPSGRTLTAEQCEEVVQLAKRHDLWLWCDEVYEHYSYTHPHTAMAALAPERSFAARSFSKAWGMAGYRVGYVVGPSEILPALRKAGTHSVYSVTTAAQLAALRVFERGDGWLAEARASYQAAGNRAAEILGQPAPEGGTFLFLDVADSLDERGIMGLLEDCLDAGLLVSPGGSCGADYGTWIRVCFTSAPPVDVERGATALAGLLAR